MKPMSVAASPLATPPRTQVYQGTHRVEARLRFAMGGGRTVLVAQHMPYPFHITRVFYLDARRPELATLYLQSASGGIYRGDRLALTIDVAAGAAVHITTQSATIVHDTRKSRAEQIVRLNVAQDAVVLFTPEPLVLFPGADVASRTEIALGAGAAAIVSDGFAQHDPKAEGRSFQRYEVSTVVHRAGRVVLADRGSVNGADIAGDKSPLGPYHASGSLFALGRASDRLDATILEARLAEAGCLGGFSRAPNDVGFAGRILAPDGGLLRRGLAAGFEAVFEAVLGLAPASRRK